MSADGSFILLLKQLTLPDQSIRQAAESRYEALKAADNVEELLAQLLHAAVDQSVEDYVRQLSCVMLRRLLVEETESFYLKLPQIRCDSSYTYTVQYGSSGIIFMYLSYTHLRKGGNLSKMHCCREYSPQLHTRSG